MTLRPLGPSVTLHGVGEDVDAAQHAVAGIAGKTNFFGSHLRSPEMFKYKLISIVKVLGSRWHSSASLQARP